MWSSLDVRTLEILAECEPVERVRHPTVQPYQMTRLSLFDCWSHLRIPRPHRPSRNLHLLDIDPWSPSAYPALQGVWTWPSKLPYITYDISHRSDSVSSSRRGGVSVSVLVASSCIGRGLWRLRGFSDPGLRMRIEVDFEVARLARGAVPGW